jgi:hypothetical protein
MRATKKTEAVYQTSDDMAIRAEQAATRPQRFRRLGDTTLKENGSEVMAAVFSTG